MYAAIEDPNNHVDLYTSGSETYAQIQPPPPAPLTVAVEINHQRPSSLLRITSEENSNKYGLKNKINKSYIFF